MCQGHEDLQPAAGSDSPSVSSRQQSQSDQKKKQKIKNKQQKQQQNAKEQTPPATPPAPTFELVKSGSSKLANGQRYIDVSQPMYSLTVDTLPHIYDNPDVPAESEAK
jgi:hypothetical protein